MRARLRGILVIGSITSASALSACAHTTRPPVAASESQPVVDAEAGRSIDESERTIEAAGGDCAAACSALAKMTSARLKLCAPRTSACPDAERREEDAGRNVKAACGKCP